MLRALVLAIVVAGCMQPSAPNAGSEEPISVPDPVVPAADAANETLEPVAAAFGQAARSADGRVVVWSIQHAGPLAVALAFVANQTMNCKVAAALPVKVHETHPYVLAEYGGGIVYVAPYDYFQSDPRTSLWLRGSALETDGWITVKGDAGVSNGTPYPVHLVVNDVAPEVDASNRASWVPAADTVAVRMECDQPIALHSTGLGVEAVLVDLTRTETTAQATPLSDVSVNATAELMVHSPHARMKLLGRGVLAGQAEITSPEGQDTVTLAPELGYRHSREGGAGLYAVSVDYGGPLGRPLLIAWITGHESS